MKLSNGQHLAYCTNIHRGESWEETFASLNRHTLRVKDHVCSEDQWYAIGLRLSAVAAKELSGSSCLKNFQKWLEKHQCYVFTINGFPYGNFHGQRVKEQVYAPDWCSDDRLSYTKCLFDILVELLPEGVDGSVSTVPGSFKEFITSQEQEVGIIQNIKATVEYMADLGQRRGKDLHLGIEPEPLGWIENIQETIAFFDRFREGLSRELWPYLGVNYDTCHMAIEYEDAGSALRKLEERDIRLSKLHLSSALKVVPDEQSLESLKHFLDDVYLHQVIARTKEGSLIRYRDLDEALSLTKPEIEKQVEWRVHFHVPLHMPDSEIFRSTSDHLQSVLAYLREKPLTCSHLEIETYTWEVMPDEIKAANVTEQLVAEYEWCLREMKVLEDCKV